MSKISEMPKLAQAGLIVLLAALATVGLYFWTYKGMEEQNRVDRQKLQARRAEVQLLRHYETEMPRLIQQTAMLKEQLEIEQRIVPDEKEADQFIHILQNAAQLSGIEIRRWTAKPVMARDFYTEVPFDLELDGPYYSLVSFFDRVSKLERIINVSNLQLSSLKSPDGKFRRGYQYAPQESVAGVCSTTTFFSHDPILAAKPAALGPAN